MCQPEDYITNKWLTPIICSLLSGEKQYGELLRSLPGISKKVLSENLRLLQDESMVERESGVRSGIIITTYRLSNKGINFTPVIDSLVKGSQRYTERTCL